MGFLEEGLLSNSLCLLGTSIELVHRTGLEESLLTSVEWVTCRTCFHTDLCIFYRALRLECVST